MTTTEQSRVSSGYAVVGTRPIRHDGSEKVTGEARYGADIRLPGMLHGRILRSPHAHARIRSIDTSRAEALPGVFAVMTSADVPIIGDQDLDLVLARGNMRLMAEHVMADRTALYKGHAVAAVAASSPHVAEDALALIDVDYEVLPAVLSLAEAMADDAPIIHEDMTTFFRLARFARGDDTGVRGNVASHIQHRLGDVEEGFRQADVVKVVPTEIGGGFGAKLVAYVEPVAAILSRKSGRPVQVVMTRKDVFEGTGPASATHAHTKIGATRDGRITAAQLTLTFEAGAFPGSAVGGGTLCATGPYNIENLLVDGYDVVVNKNKTQAYRAPGSRRAPSPSSPSSTSWRSCWTSTPSSSVS